MKNMAEGQNEAHIKFQRCLLYSKHFQLLKETEMNIKELFFANKTVAGSVIGLCDPPYTKTDKPVEV